MKLFQKFFGKKDELDNVEKIFHYNKQAKEIIKELEGKRLPERVYKPVATAFPLYIKGISQALEDMVRFKPENEEELEEFNKNVIKSLKTIQNFQLNQGKLVAIVFEEEVLKLGGIFNKIIEIQQEIGKEVEKRKIARYKKDELKHYKEKYKKIEQKINKKNKEIQTLNKEIENLEKELNAIKFDATAKKKIEEELSILELRILSIIGIISKELKKDKKRDELVENYLKKPLKTFLEDDKLKIADIIEDLKIKKIKKDELRNLRDKYKALKDEELALKKKLDKINNIKEKIRINRMKLEKLEKEKERLEQKKKYFYKLLPLEATNNENSENNHLRHE